MATAAAAFDLQGHRGARGHAPENTRAGFQRALSIGVTTLETDLAVTQDGVVVLSHDPVLNPDLTRGPDGTWLSARGPAIKTLRHADLEAYDVGRANPASAYARQFPLQVPVDGERIPTLVQLLAMRDAAGRAPRINIEIKTSPLQLEETMAPEDFAARVIEVVRHAGVGERTTIQSFDWRALQAVRSRAPDLATSCLTIDTPRDSTIRPVDGKPSPWLGGLDPGDYAGSVPRLVVAAGCRTWSPYWRNLDAAAVADAHARGLAVVPWTVNDRTDIAAVVDLGVDGLITDYPDVARAVLGEKHIDVR